MRQKGTEMKIAIIGSRSIAVSDIKRYIPKDTTEIVSGGAKGVDQDAKKYANENHISYKEYKPNYRLYGKGAPLKRNIEIINYADKVVALLDGKSRGTHHVIQTCLQKCVPIDLWVMDKEGNMAKKHPEVT